MMDQSRKIGSMAISASAGYGKTESLCMRMLAILLAEPELGNLNRTMALTFARAAAGEILIRLIQLPTAVLNGQKDFVQFTEDFARLSGPGFGNITREELLDLLVRLCDRLSELKISTIDSLMVELAGACALELGFFKEPEIIDPDLEKAVAEELLQELFAHPDKEVINICRESMIGKEKRNFAQTCREFLDKLAKWQELMPDDRAWGRFPDIEWTVRDKLAEALAVCDAKPPHPQKYGEKLRPLLAHCAKMSEKECFTKDELKILNAFFDAWDTYPNFDVAGFSAARKWDFSGCAEAIRLLLTHARNILLDQAKQRTRAANELVSHYNELFEKRVWNSGCFRFSDLSRLLHSRDGMLAEQQFRLNMQFRHFLLDEFQDTSRMQWNIMKDIIADNGDGDHTLTLVGDVKQAIYSWRDGDSRLMGEVTDELIERTEDPAQKAKIRHPLQESFRYGQPICDGLNHLFMEALPACAKVPGSVRAQWQDAYPEHRPHRDGKHPEKPGLFAVCSIIEDPGREYLEQVADFIADRLREIRFRERGLSCAILVRKNDEGPVLKACLSSKPGLSADDFIQEGNATLITDRVNRGLTALLYYLQHPADTVSREILLMDPVLSSLCPEDGESFARERLRLAEKGVTEYLADCIRKIAARTGDAPEAFAHAILTAARQYETASPDFNAAEFRAIMQNRRLGSAVQPGKVRILTVHRSKGLTFDVTFYPIKDAKAVNYVNPPLGQILTGKDWLLYDAGKAARTIPELREAGRMAGDQLIFDDLCALYVALTRARYETCVFVPPPGTRDKRLLLDDAGTGKDRKRIGEMQDTSYFVNDLLHDAFFLDDQAAPAGQPLPKIEVDEQSAYCRTFGDRQWFEKLSAPKPAPAVELFRLPEAVCPPRPIRVAPSRTEEENTQKNFSFPPRTDRGDAGTVFGTKVHEFFEKIEDLRTFTPPEDTPPEILRHLDACRANPKIVELLSGSSGELWRERRFDLILREDGMKKFVSGCFDRVRIRRDASGKAESAVLVDYKSNDLDASGIPAAVAHYRPQMDLYARALARLLKLEPKDISGYLIFTKIGALHRM